VQFVHRALVTDWQAGSGTGVRLVQRSGSCSDPARHADEPPVIRAGMRVSHAGW
jgi:hypothetical protein